MSNLKRHHDLALQILVGRALALKQGLPWTPEEDRDLIIRERFLWASLTPEEQAEEQQFLAKFWGGRGRRRVIKADPAWGSWAHGQDIEIPDEAFGLPAEHYRPFGKGVAILADEHPKLKPLLTWLWRAGFQPAVIREDTVACPIPVSRIVPETERLAGVIARTFPAVRLTDGVVGGGIRIQAVYDAATGQAVIHLEGCGELLRQFEVHA